MLVEGGRGSSRACGTDGGAGHVSLPRGEAKSVLRHSSLAFETAARWRRRKHRARFSPEDMERLMRHAPTTFGNKIGRLWSACMWAPLRFRQTRGIVLTQPPSRPATAAEITRQFSDLGVRPGDLLMVHASLRSVGPVEGGADALLHCLLSAGGPGGTLMGYASWDRSPYEETLNGATLADDERSNWPALRQGRQCRLLSVPGTRYRRLRHRLAGASARSTIGKEPQRPRSLHSKSISNRLLPREDDLVQLSYALVS